MTNDDKQINYNEWDVPSPAEEAVIQARRNIALSQMHLVEPNNFGDNTPDDLLYSLECSQAMELPSERRWDFAEDFEDVLEPMDDLGSDFAHNKPELTAVTGTYAVVSAYANTLNNKQKSSGGIVHWVYAPQRIEKLAA